MNIEKLVNSKFYRGFEWFYRLIFLNLLILIVSLSLAAIPFLYWYNNYFVSKEKGFIVLISLILFTILFIPAFMASFKVIKHYMDDNTGNVFVLYFNNLIKTVKEIYLLEIVLMPILIILIYGISYYWQILSPEYYQNNFYGYIAIGAFVIEFFLIVGLILVFINLNFITTYFKMRTFDYLKLSIKFSFRYMGQSLLAIVVLFIPFILLFLIGMKFVPLYFIFGFSLPQYVMYFIIRNKYNYLEKNVDDLDSENKYE